MRAECTRNSRPRKRRSLSLRANPEPSRNPRSEAATPQPADKQVSLSILDSICPRPLRLTRLFLLPPTRANCHKRIVFNQQEVSQWLKHSECFLVLSFWRLESSDSFPESAPQDRMGCRCCLAS